MSVESSYEYVSQFIMEDVLIKFVNRQNWLDSTILQDDTMPSFFSDQKSNRSDLQLGNLSYVSEFFWKCDGKLVD